MRLPPHFIPRPRLTRRCEHAQVVVVEAAAGCGKSVLGLELAAHWGSVPVVVLLERAEVSAPLLVARTRAAVKAAGYTDAAAAAAEAGEDAVGALDAMLTALAGEQCTFLIDDAHEASADAAALLERFASNLSGHQHLVVLCRRLPEGASRLERAVHVALDGADLCLTADETLEVCRRGFHVDVPTDAAGLLHEATGGWTAAVVLTASRAARTGAPLDARSHVASPASHGDVVARILDDTLQSIGGDAPAAFAQVGRLPLVSADLVDELTGCRGLFALALDRGMPFTPSRDQWWELPNVVRERLAAVAPADPDALRHAAEVYAACGETRAALELLLGAGEFHACAAVLAGAPRVTELMDVAELEAIVDVLPASAIEAHPLVLLHLSRSLRVATRFEDANALLDRVRGLAATPQSEELDRAVRAEYAHDLMIRLQPSDAQVVAREVLATASSDEVLTRARASAALGMALCWQLDESGRRRDERALDEASASFERATRLFHQLSMPAAAAAVVPYWAVSIEFSRGRARTALEMLDAALAEGVGSPRRWAYVQTFRALVAADLGLDDVCADAIDDTLRVAAQLQSDLLFALGYWRLAILSSYRGDAETTLASVRQVEAHRGTWWAPGSGDFLAEATDCLDRVGLVEIAREYLERVQAEPKDVAHLVAMAAAAVEARHGDPDVAVSLLADVAESRIDTRERWRVTLLEAYARFRGGRHGEAGVLAARAFEQAAALGQPRLPLVKEPGVTAELLGLAVETGQPASLALHDVSLPRRLALLGRVELRCGGRLVPLAAGQERQLLTLVALRERVHAEAVISHLWPDADTETGKRRLRTVLSRLRTAAGDVVVRDGDTLALADDVVVDVGALHADAARVRAIAPSDPRLAASIARGAISRYRGELLADEPYEDWATGPRELARRTAMALLEQCSDEAAARGDLDEVRRLVHRGIEVHPYDDALYARAARLLIEQGRRAEALSILRSARAALDQLGVEVPPVLVELESSAAP